MRPSPESAPVTPPRPPHTRDGPPRAVNCTSGPNAPWSLALQWCGWLTSDWDWLIDESHDLSDHAVQKRVEADMVDADAILWQMDCSSLTKAREIPAKGRGGAPPRLRGQGKHVEGLPELKQADRERHLRRVDRANECVRFSGRTLAWAAKRGMAIVAENPRNSFY